MLKRLSLIALFLWPVTSTAQQQDASAALLIADDLFITAERELVATGNVEAFQGGTRIQAREIRYNQSTGALTIVGPISLRDGDTMTVLADAAELSPDLQSGLLTGARIVMDQQLQLAAVQLERVDARYSQLYKTAVTSCHVCDDGRPPLWQIRAKRVIHDREERQLYFDQAQFRIRNVPVFYIPRLRLPDPTLDRATGFLIPEYYTSSELGAGIKVPYFIKLGDHRDLTLRPYVSPQTRTLEFRYRQAFVNGDMIFEGALSEDDLIPGELRGYLFALGAFSLPKDFRLAFDLELTSDDSYLDNYNYSDKDRLDSNLTIGRVRKDELIEGTITHYQSLRDDEDSSTLPSIEGNAVYEARYFPGYVGGELRLKANGNSFYRTSDTDIIGRDVARLNLDADWLRTWALRGGLVAQGRLGLAADGFDVSQDSTFPKRESQISPRGSIALRYPMTRRAESGVQHFLEPIAQIGWSGGDRLDVPNEESTRVEFDSGNLLSLSRFPEPDRRERGTVAAYGVNWTRFHPEGWDTALTVGQVVRDKSDPAFTLTSGLDGTTSDLLVAGQIKSPLGFAVTARTLFEDAFDMSKAELRGDYSIPRITLGGTYVWITKDPAEDRDINTEEVALFGTYRIDEQWDANADWRFDLEQSRASEVGLGLDYTNECVRVSVDVNRRFTNSSSLEPSTSLGFTVSLRGFAVQAGTQSYKKSCG
jgi:LPS-assembly protein